MTTTMVSIPRQAGAGPAEADGEPQRENLVIQIGPPDTGYYDTVSTGGI
jgi:hypothetical protein